MTAEIDAEEIQRRYADGESIKALASDLGVSTSTIHARLPERRRPGRRSRAGVDTAEIVRLHDEEGVSLREIADRLGINKSTASRRYHAATA